MLIHTFTTSARRALLAATLAFATATTSYAANVNWGAATNITGNSDVSTAGALISAFTFGGQFDTPVATTVNGTLFQPFNVVFGNTSVTVGNTTLAVSAASLTGATVSAGAAPFSSLSAAYQNLLRTEVNSATLVPMRMTLSGLTVGQSYQFQWWCNDSLLGGSATSTTATAGNSVLLNSNTPNALGGLGQFAIGIFTADATTQQIVFTNSSNPTCVNAAQLRLLPASAVPEPGSALAGLLALGACAGGLLRRNRQGVVRG